MASQTPNAPAGKPAKAAPKKADAPLWGIKNPFIYAGTVVFLVVVIVAFVFFPTSVGVSGGASLEFGSYNGRSITYTQGSYFVREVSALTEANPAQGQDEYSNQLRNYQIYREAFERSILHEAILDEVDRAGIIVPEAVLDREMGALPMFQENNAFSPRLYRQMDATRLLELRRDLRDQFLQQAYSSPVFGVKPGTKESEFIAAMAKETRTVDYALFPLSSYPDAEVTAWAAGKADLFRRLKVSRITMAKEGEVAALKKKIEGGLAFADAAKASSTDAWAQQGGDMGLRFYHDLESDLATAGDAASIAALAVGGVSSVVKTSTGSFAIFKLEDAIKAPEFTDPVVLADARGYLQKTERGKIEEWVLAKAKAFSQLPPADFAANARKEGVTVKAAGPFALDFGDLALDLGGQSAPLFTPIPVSGAPELAAASRNEKFLSAAFGLQPGAVSEPFLLGDNFLVLRVKEAGSAGDTSLVSLYYPYFVQQKIDEDVRATFLASPKVKDNFMNVYLKHFSPKPAKK